LSAPKQSGPDDYWWLGFTCSPAAGVGLGGGVSEGALWVVGSGFGFCWAVAHTTPMTKNAVQITMAAAARSKLENPEQLSLNRAM